MKKKLMATVLAGVMAVSMLATGVLLLQAADPISSPVRSVIS